MDCSVTQNLLKKLGEETIYSAKGHFKACDIRRKEVSLTIWGCAILNVIGIVGIHLIVDKWLSAIGLFGTIALLIWNEGEGKNYRAKHKIAAEKYLAFHKQARSYYCLNNYTTEQVMELDNEIRQFGQSDKPDINGFARKWAKKAIEKNDPETDNWFKNP